MARRQQASICAEREILTDVVRVPSDTREEPTTNIERCMSSKKSKHIQYIRILRAPYFSVFFVWSNFVAHVFFQDTYLNADRLQGLF